MQALGEAEQPGGPGGPIEHRQVQQPHVGGNPLVRPVGDVVEQARDEHDGQAGQQNHAEDGGEPRTAQRTAEPRTKASHGPDARDAGEAG